MAQKKKPPKKTGWIKSICLYVFLPLGIWGLAFLLWLYWDGLAGLFSQDSGKNRPVARTGRKADKTDPSSAKQPTEKLLDEDRQRLEDILKQRK
jgi:hypothetical protein